MASLVKLPADEDEDKDSQEDEEDKDSQEDEEDEEDEDFAEEEARQEAERSRWASRTRSAQKKKEADVEGKEGEGESDEESESNEDDQEDDFDHGGRHSNILVCLALSGSECAIMHTPTSWLRKSQVHKGGTQDVRFVVIDGPPADEVPKGLEQLAYVQGSRQRGPCRGGPRGGGGLRRSVSSRKGFGLGTDTSVGRPLATHWGALSLPAAVRRPQGGEAAPLPQQVGWLQLYVPSPGNIDRNVGFASRSSPLCACCGRPIPIPKRLAGALRTR
eukprot:COSAG04_NODE_456_length_14055_cov_41.823660_11_plen_274_part_00